MSAQPIYNHQDLNDDPHVPDFNFNAKEGVQKLSEDPFEGSKILLTAGKVVATALIVIFSVGVLLAFSPLMAIGALGSALIFPKFSLWNEIMSMALLPAAYLKKEQKALPDEAYAIKIPVSEGVELEGAVLLAKGVSKEVAVKLPVVVLFNQNARKMQDHIDSDESFSLVSAYQERGFNVVLFNYRGVEGSTGQVRVGNDLIEDGKGVVSQLIEKGFNLEKKGENGHQILIKPEVKDILLDGSSIGGAVATAVGAEYPEMMLAANRTFTSWLDAAEGVVAKFSNEYFGKMAKWVLNQTEHAQSSKMDNIEKITQRMKAHNLAFTVIETAKLGESDGVLSSQAKLEEGFIKNNEGNGIYSFTHFKENIKHNTLLLLSDRNELSAKVEEVSQKTGYFSLLQLKNIKDSIKRIIELEDQEIRGKNNTVFFSELEGEIKKLEESIKILNTNIENLKNDCPQLIFNEFLTIYSFYGSGILKIKNVAEEIAKKEEIIEQKKVYEQFEQVNEELKKLMVEKNGISQRIKGFESKNDLELIESKLEEFNNLKNQKKELDKKIRTVFEEKRNLEKELKNREIHRLKKLEKFNNQINKLEEMKNSIKVREGD